MCLAAVPFITLLLAGPLQAEEAAGSDKPVEVTNAAQRLSVKEVSATVVDEVITIAGKWGDFIHGKSYQQEALVSHKGWQYTTYYDAKRRLCVARRALPSGLWQTIRFSDYTYHGDDNHNVPVIGICPADGTIHLAFDHHNNPLRYRVSRANAANDPAAAVWDSSLFGPVVDSLVAGQRVKGVTYPQFVMAPDSTLLLFFRVGTAFDGRIWMSKYSPAGWLEPWQVTASTGSYKLDGKTSAGRNAYLNNPCIDSKGRIHLSWIWREGGTLKDAQHDLCYMHSDDGGRTFLNQRGEVVTKDRTLAGVDSADLTLWPISARRGLKNQQAMAIDSNGRPHIVMWYLADSEPDIAVAAKDHTKSKYYHFWQSADGKWHKQELPFSLSRDEWTIRPQLAFGKDGDLFLVYNRDSNIVIAAATRAGGFADWSVVAERAGRFTGEAKLDLLRLRHENIISIYMHEIPNTAHAGTPLRVIDFSIQVP